MAHLIMTMAMALYLVSTPAFSSELPPDTRLNPLASITNDRNRNVCVLGVVIDNQEEAQALHLETTKNDTQPPSVERRLITQAQIQSESGVVLYKDGKHKVFILKGKIDNQKGHANLVLYYLSNGLTGAYKECKLTAKRTQQGNWTLFNAYTGQVIETMHAVSWTLGIKTVENVCPQQKSIFWR